MFYCPEGAYMLMHAQVNQFVLFTREGSLSPEFQTYMYRHMGCWLIINHYDASTETEVNGSLWTLGHFISASSFIADRSSAILLLWFYLFHVLESYFCTV